MVIIKLYFQAVDVKEKMTDVTEEKCTPEDPSGEPFDAAELMEQELEEVDKKKIQDDRIAVKEESSDENDEAIKTE